jgi:DNA-3-methyladenine glycosylase II
MVLDGQWVFMFEDDALARAEQYCCSMNWAADVLSRSLMRFVICPKPPFDFERSAHMLVRFKNSLPDVYEDGRYMRVLHINKNPVLVSVSSRGTTWNPRLIVEVYARLNKKSEKESLRHVLKSMFESSFDYRKFHAVAKKDPLMRTIVERLKGLRPIRPPSFFESIIIAITEQQISLHAAVAIRSRLIQKYGDRVVRDGRTFFAFPTPESLAKAHIRGLRSIGLSAVKARYISEFSKKVASGEFDLERLTEMGNEQVIAELTKLRGIGRWTAEYALVRGMGRVNSLPADDLGIQRAVSQAYAKGRRISADEARIVLGKFAPYSGIAAFYLMYHLFWERLPQ